MRSTRRSDPSSAARPREPTRPVSPVAPRSERKRCRRPQTASAPCGRPRQTRHASDGSCRRPAKEPAPLARSSGHRRATPAHWLAEPTDASPTHRAPARSVQNVHLPTRSQGESSPQTNPTQPAWQELFAFPMSRGIHCSPWRSKKPWSWSSTACRREQPRASFMYETPAATPMAPCPQASGAERLALPPGSEERAMLSSSNNRLEILRLGPELWTSTYEGTSGLRHAHCVGGARDGRQ